MLKNYFLLLTLSFISFVSISQTPIWTEAFQNACASDCPGNGYAGPNGAWAVSSTGVNGADANLWYVSGAECGNAATACGSGCGAADPAVREAAEAVAIMLSVVAPYTAEDMWAKLGHQPSVARASWPTVDPSLLVQDSVTCVVQVAGKVKDRLDVSPDIDPTELEKLALASESVQAALGGQSIRTVIVRAPKLVNVVPG